MSSDPQVRELLDHIQRLRTAASHIEAVAVEYAAAIDPVRVAAQGVGDVPLDEQEQWVAATHSVAKLMVEVKLADMLVELRDVPRWRNALGGGAHGKAIAGAAFRHLLETAPTLGASAGDEFFATLAVVPLSRREATAEVSDFLGYIVHVHTDRTARGFFERVRALLSGIGFGDGELAAWQLTRHGIQLSPAAAKALRDWEECRCGCPCYGTIVRPTAPQQSAEELREPDAKPDVLEEYAAGTQTAPPTDGLDALRLFARKDLKGIERAVVDALCDACGELPLADLAFRDGVGWEDAKRGFTDAQRRLNPKLKSKGWQVSRHDNAARLVPVKPPKTR